MEEDRAPYRRRTTVAEAAEVLGISAEAVRGRIRRGTLQVEREGGTVYVILEITDQTRTSGDQPTDRTDLLIAELQDRIRSLEEANRENRRIIAALTSRIPELPAASSTEASESPETPSEDGGMASSTVHVLSLIAAIVGSLAAIAAGFVYSVISALNGDQIVALLSALIGLTGTIGGTVLAVYLTRPARNRR